MGTKTHWGSDFALRWDRLFTRDGRVDHAWFHYQVSRKRRVVWVHSKLREASSHQQCSANDAFCEEIDASATRESREDHAGKGEGKGKEGERKEGDSTPQAKLDPESDSLRSRINKWFRRREGTEWQASELKALKSVVKLNTPESDLQLLDARYESKNKYRRKDILTLLNNWNTEIDRCKSGDDDSQQSLPIQSNGSSKLDEDIRSYL